jgi:hypothetical protein
MSASGQKKGNTARTEYGGLLVSPLLILKNVLIVNLIKGKKKIHLNPIKIDLTSSLFLFKKPSV